MRLVPFVRHPSLLGVLVGYGLSICPTFESSNSVSMLRTSMLKYPAVYFGTNKRSTFPSSILLGIPMADSCDDGLRTFTGGLL